MTTVSGRKASKNVKTSTVSDVNYEFSKIKDGIKHNEAKIVEFLQQRVGPGDWKLTETNVPLDDEAGTIDMVFSASDGKKEKYILVDISVPHLGVGQKYLLPTQAKVFQKQREVPVTRIKKAIILVRKGTETISIQSLKVRCPIIEIQIENILKQKTSSNKPVSNERKEYEEKNPKIENINSEDVAEQRSHRSKDNNIVEEPKHNNGFASLSEDLLFALKEAVVHESLSTTYKRNNKYIRRGLWHWIEREIMDPNVHFFLIILSSIYQSKTGEILSKKFRTIESYSENPENVINAIFSRENALADEIKRNSERHKKALTKFLGCFSQTPPFEYLKSLFLKEFRSNSDGLKARMSVFTTLGQLLARCGFEGEKEINYPLEILDELKIFQGVMCGNYETLRTDNASKKLKHLVPQIEWEADDIYALRNQLAKVLNLPSAEFNLNAYLPQAFVQDARNMAESRKEAMKLNSVPKESQNTRNYNNEVQKQESEDSSAKLSRQERMALQKQLKQLKMERQSVKRRYDDEYMPKKHHQQDDIDMPMLSENGDFLTEEALAERNDRDRLILQEMGNDEVKRILDDPYAYTKPTSKKTVYVEENDETEEEVESENNLPQPTIENEPIRERRRSRYTDVDESRHRHFENYGGIEEEDPDVIKLSLALARHDEKDENNDENEDDNRFNTHEVENEIDDSIYEEAPTKSMIMQGYRPSNGHMKSNRTDNGSRRQNYHNRPANENRNENHNGGSNNSSRNRNNRSGRNNNNSNTGYRESKKYYSSRNNSNFRRRSSRREGRN